MDIVESPTHDQLFTKFCLKIDPELEHLELPRMFFEYSQKELGHIVEVTDPKGNILNMRVFVSNKNAVLWESIPQLMKYYGLGNTHFIQFEYKSSNKFNIKIYTNMTEISYPSNGMEENIVLSSDSEDEPIGRDNVIILDSDKEHEMVEDEPKMSNIRTYRFEKKITRAIASGKHTLCIPVDFARGYVKRDWLTLSLVVKDKEPFKCNLLWSDPKRNHCRLGKGWYEFVNIMRLEPGDVVEFESDDDKTSHVNVEIARRVM